MSLTPRRHLPGPARLLGSALVLALMISVPATLLTSGTALAQESSPTGYRIWSDQVVPVRTAAEALTAHRGVFAYRDGSPSQSHRQSNYYFDVVFDPDRESSPSPTPPLADSLIPTGFPNAGDTGVPPGVQLTPYTGPMRITSPGTVIDAKRITGTLAIEAEDVTIRNSHLRGRIDADDTGRVSVTVLDSTVDGGTDSAPAIGFSDITMRRVEVIGARVSVLCGSNCDIQDSWLHAQYLQPGSAWHVNGYVSNGGSDVVVRHNTIACDPPDNGHGGGCTGPGASFGDFAPLRDITYDRNLFVAGPGGYCLHAGHHPGKPYGDDPTNIRVTDNVFQRGGNGRCGVWGAVTGFLDANGNVTSGNVWDDGSPLERARRLSPADPGNRPIW